MQRRIRSIILVSSLYDLYILEEDGRLYETLRMEYQVRELSNAPEIVSISSGREALLLAGGDKPFDLIICTLHIQDMSAANLAREVGRRNLDIPIILLARDYRELTETISEADHELFEKIFIWQGDLGLLITIVKYLEDRMNVDHDTAALGVQVILVVEDDINFYSPFLTLIYSTVMEQSRHLIIEGMNDSHRLVRMRARPKILLCSSYEEALEAFTKYGEYVLGVISDIDFSREGAADPEAGFLLVRTIKERYPDIPVLLQSNRPENEAGAEACGVSFIRKNSPQLMNELRGFMLRHFGFGDFVFTDESGEVYGTAQDLVALEQMISKVPDSCLRYHVERNHFSNWLKARTEFWLANRLRPHKLSDFPSLDALRADLIESLRNYRDRRMHGVIIDYSADTFDTQRGFARIGGGSLGGKARGLSFMNKILIDSGIPDWYPDTDIFVPATVVIGTDVFDSFTESSGLKQFALNEESDDEIDRKFLSSDDFPDEELMSLRRLVDSISYPLAIRSSSLLEDSQYHPFAGVYETYFLPNNNPDAKERFAELLRAVKLIYASTYHTGAKRYFDAIPHRLEDEKMAVMIQRMVGNLRGNNSRFYPDFAGIAKSYNYYPIPPQEVSDGLISIAVGLGKTVVEGGWSLKISPKHPNHIPQLRNTEEALQNNQRTFFALDLEHSGHSFPLSTAEEDGALRSIASTYSAENDAIYPGTSRPGQRIITFNTVLKSKRFPFPGMVAGLLALCADALAMPVEIEFAVEAPEGKSDYFLGILQLRPLIVNREAEDLDVEIDEAESHTVLCKSSNVLGNGIIPNLRDILVVDRYTFDRSRTQAAAEEISRCNARLARGKRPYLLVVLGRLGSLDPWLGIPVSWDQISGAHAIIETGFDDLAVEPSQGSHFFHNVTALQVAYFTIDPSSEKDSIDWSWLLEQSPTHQSEFVRHLSFDEALTIKINGKERKGIVLKPSSAL